MPRLTIPLSDAPHPVIKQASAPRELAMEPFMIEQVKSCTIKPQGSARALVQRARSRSRLSEERALALAQEQVRLVRQK